MSHGPAGVGAPHRSSPEPPGHRFAARSTGPSRGGPTPGGNGASNGHRPYRAGSWASRIPGSGVPRAPARALSAKEFDRRLEHVARVLVKTIRAVPMPGVSPFTRRDWIIVVGVVLTEALVVVLLVAGAQR